MTPLKSQFDTFSSFTATGQQPNWKHVGSFEAEDLETLNSEQKPA